MADVLTPHFTIPMQMSGDRVAVVEEDSEDEVMQGAAMVPRYIKGQRTALPDFGINDQTHRMGGPDLAGIRSAINTWEPRAQAVLSSQQVDDAVYEATIELSKKTAGEGA
jgi:predicted component of type VI protein secretion system